MSLNNCFWHSHWLLITPFDGIGTPLTNQLLLSLASYSVFFLLYPLINNIIAEWNNITFCDTPFFFFSGKIKTTKKYIATQNCITTKLRYYKKRNKFAYSRRKLKEYIRIIHKYSITNPIYTKIKKFRPAL